MKTENPIVCVTVNCKLYRIAIALQLPVVPSCVNKVSINLIIQSRTRLIRQAQTPTLDNTYRYILLLEVHGYNVVTCVVVTRP
jgi:hypothetical protein